MKKNILFAVMTIGLMLLTPTSAEIVIFDNTNFSVKIFDSSLVSNSSAIEIKIDNLPSLGSNVSFVLLLQGNNKEFVFREAAIFDAGFNIISESSGYNISLRTSDQELLLYSHLIPNRVNLHMGHIYGNWTFGIATPDGRGFGQGVITDLKILDSIVENLDESNLLVTSERIQNLLFGTVNDYNGDESISSDGDGYGLFNYTIGMRDHIFNAGSSSDATSAQSANATATVSEIGKIISDDYPNFISNLDTSDSLGADFYRLARDLVNSSIIDLRSKFTEMRDILTSSYFGFRSFIMDADFTVDGSFGHEGTSTSDTEVTYFPVFFVLPVLIVLVKKFNKN